jgi:DNA-binding MarR family transcriptional regulator
MFDNCYPHPARFASLRSASASDPPHKGEGGASGSAGALACVRVPGPSGRRRLLRGLAHEFTRLGHPIIQRDRVPRRKFGRAPATIGMFALIYALERDEEPLTAARLARFAGMSEPQVHIHVQKLIDRGLVSREKIKGPHGKGRSFRLSIKHTGKTKRLIAAIESK